MTKRVLLILLTAFLTLSVFSVGLSASPFEELHVSGPCEVRLVFNPDSAGMVTMPRNVGSRHGLVVRRTDNAMYVILAPDSLASGRLPVNVYCTQGLTLIDASGRALVKGGLVDGSRFLSVVASGAASVDLGGVSAGNVNVSLTGSGTIKIDGEISASNINFSLTGSGKISADAITATRLSVTQRGSGKIRLAGSAHNCAVVGQGSGIIDARSLVSADMNLKLFGPGQIYYPAGVRATLDGKTSNIHAVKPYQPL